MSQQSNYPNQQWRQFMEHVKTKTQASSSGEDTDQFNKLQEGFLWPYCMFGEQVPNGGPFWGNTGSKQTENRAEPGREDIEQTHATYPEADNETQAVREVTSSMWDLHLVLCDAHNSLMAMHNSENWDTGVSNFAQAVSAISKVNEQWQARFGRETSGGSAFELAVRQKVAELQSSASAGVAHP